MTDQIVEMPVVTTSEPVTVPSSPLRAQYDVWVATMTDIRTINPGIIVDIISPDSLNNDLTLEQIDARWNELQKKIDPDMLGVYELCKDYLAKPRIMDTFADSIEGHNERRKFRITNQDRDQRFFEALNENDLRMDIIAPALGAVELFEIITDDSNLMKRHAAIFSEIRDSSDADKKEIYSRMSRNKKVEIAARVRELAREVFLIDIEC